MSANSISSHSASRRAIPAPVRLPLATCRRRIDRPAAYSSGLGPTSHSKRALPRPSCGNQPERDLASGRPDGDASCSQVEGGNIQRAATRLGVTDRAIQMRRAAGQLGHGAIDEASAEARAGKRPNERDMKKMVSNDKLRPVAFRRCRSAPGRGLGDGDPSPCFRDKSASGQLSSAHEPSGARRWRTVATLSGMTGLGALLPYRSERER